MLKANGLKTTHYYVAGAGNEERRFAVVCDENGVPTSVGVHVDALMGGSYIHVPSALFEHLGVIVRRLRRDKEATWHEVCAEHGMFECGVDPVCPKCHPHLKVVDGPKEDMGLANAVIS